MNKHYALVILLVAIAQFVAANFSFSSSNWVSAPNFVTLGNTRVNSSGIRLTEQGDALGNLMFHRYSVGVANGFTTSFDLDITNCDVPYGGADGFAFVIFPEIPARNSYLIGGSGLSLTALNNFAAVPFLLGRDALGFCAINSRSNMSGLALWDELDYCTYDSSQENVLTTLRCTGPHNISIKFTPPASWEALKVTVDSSFTYYGTLNISGLLDWNYNAYVGFSGGVAGGYMDQFITAWSMTIDPGCLGACDPVATCINNVGVTCTCPSGYFGDGSFCAIIEPPAADVVPILECFEDLGAGSYRAHFGYQNNEPRLVSIPRGPNNDVIGTTDTNQPTVFQSGRTPFYPLSAFQHVFNGGLISWRLTKYNLTVDVTDTSRLCPPDLKVALKFWASTAVEKELIREKLSESLSVTIDRITILNETLSGTVSKKRAVNVGVVELEIEIAATNSTTEGEPSASDAVEDLVNTAQNAAQIQQIVNPTDSDPFREYVSVKPLPTGVESQGQVVPIPPVAPISPSTPTAPTAPTPTSTPIKPSSSGVRIGAVASLVSAAIVLVL